MTGPSRATPRRRRTVLRRAGGLALAAAVTWSVSACGVTTQDEPEPVEPAATVSVPTPTVTVVPDDPPHTSPTADLSTT